MSKHFLKSILLFAGVYLLLFTAQSQQCNIIYVTPTGAGSGSAGTRANPASLTYGLTLVNATNNIIWMAVGVYDINNEIQLVSNLTIEGGFDPTNWSKSNASATVIHRTPLNVLPSPANGTAAFVGPFVSGFRLQDLTINVDVPNGVAATAYGIYLNACSNYNIVRCVVNTAGGTPGVNGSPGAAGAPGGNGAPGTNGGLEPVKPGGAGGVGGTNGGNGANSGVHGSVGPPGQPGGGTCGGAGGTTGTGPSCNLGCTFGSPNCNTATPGQPGQPGGAGTIGGNGTAGPVGVVSAPGYFIPGVAATNGTNGTPGCGGGGGGGGGGRQNNGQDDVGGAGGGGGGGGFGGGGGTGGSGGGGSFAVFLYSNGAGGNIADCSLNAGPGGAGGVGGSGGVGGAGGTGGTGGTPGCGNTPGGNGGAGGAGGAGGNGGSGAAGLSQNLYVNGTTPTQSNITSVPGNPPVITVLNYGCTNAEVLFSAPASGTWNFGADATPATATGAGPITVMYSTTGRKSITFNGTVFTDFVGIFNNQTPGSTITHTNVPAVNGCPDTFSTTIIGSLYEWDFGGSSIPLVAVGPNLQNAPMAFTAPGTYTVVVWVTTPCCGRVKDSLLVNVQPNTLNITLAASANTICEGDPITYTASPNTYLLYTFIVNGNQAQSSPSPTFTANGLQQGDSVMVLGFNGICFSNPSSVHYPVVNPIPSVTITSSDADNVICGGDLVTFTATPAGYDNYDFYNGSSLQQSGPSNVWNTTQLGQGNSVYCIATDNNCPSNASNLIVTTVNPTPFVTLSVPSANVCAGTNVTLTASPPGFDNYEFFVNGSSVQNGGSNTYSSSVFNNNDAITVVATQSSCQSAPSTSVVLTVTPTPVVTLSSSDADNSICQGDAVTFTASPAGYSSYEFFDNSTSLQNSSTNIFTTNLLLNGNSITVVATDNGCPSAPSSAIVTAVQLAPVVNAGTDATACIDAGTQTLTGFLPAGGGWTGTGVTNSSGVFDPATAGAGSWSLVYAYTDANTGCSGRDSILFNVYTLPNIGLPASTSICEGGSTVLNANGGVSYAWTPATNLSNASISNPTANPASATTYTVSVTDANNCSNTASITVNVNPNPVPSFTVQNVCQGEVSSIVNNTTPANATYNWNFGDGISSTASSPNHTYASAGNYTIVLTASLGNCSATFTANTTVNPAAVAGFSANPLVGYNDASSPITFTNTSQNSDTWLWTFGDGSNSTTDAPVHFYSEPGTYTVSLTASNQYGCSSTVTQTNYIQIFELPRVYIPTAFSPNGDGANDILHVLTSGTKYFNFKLYNRWGEKVFETSNSLDGWDGMYKGVAQPMGVFTYTLNAAFDDNTSRLLKGTITLLR